jgi:hypothetical protein
MHYAEHPVGQNALYGRVETSGPSAVTVVPDPRTHEEYADEVERYLKVAASAIADRADRLLPLRRLSPMQLTARSLTDSTLNAIQLTMVFPGQAQLQLVDPDSSEPDLTALPEPPEPFGTPRTTMRPGPAFANAALLNAHLRAQARSSSRETIAVPRLLSTGPAEVTATLAEDGVEIRFPPFDLRSEETYSLPPLFLDFLEAEGTSHQVRWKATSNNQPGTSSGSLQVNLTRSPFDLNRLASGSDFRS